MAKANTAEDQTVEESALGIMEGDLDLPKCELHPVGDKPATIRNIAVSLSKSSDKPMLAVTCVVSPEDYQFGYDVTNAPDGLINTIYVTNIGFGHDASLLSGKYSNPHVEKVRNLFEKCGEPWKNLRYGPRDDLLGEIFLTDDTLRRLVGKRVQVSIVHEKNLDDEMAIKFNRLAPLP